MVEAGITYIADRGYVSVPLYRDLMERGAYFVIRERHTLRYRVLAALYLTVDGLVTAGRLRVVQDAVIQLTRGEMQTVLRLVEFWCGTHRFLVVTNRFDLTTARIVRLYAWRWQVELLFRAWKHTLGALHLVNLSEAGIAVQFQVLLLASLLWARLQQETAQRAAGNAGRRAARPRTLTGCLSQLLQVGWRLCQKALRVVRNCLAQPLSTYVVNCAELNL